MARPMNDPFDPAERLEVLRSFVRRLRSAPPESVDKLTWSLASWVGNRMADVERKEGNRFDAGRRIGFQDGTDAVQQLREALKAILEDD